MKKSTLIKVLCLALVSLFAFSLVACGGAGTGNNNANKIAIYLDPNGGSLDGDDVIYVNEGEAIGKLPTPTRAGYDFLGWYEDGNERWEVDRRTKAEYEMEIVALWEPKGDLLTVDYKLAVDESLADGAALYFEVVKGQKILTSISSLPVAQKEDTTDAYYKFIGWKDAQGNDITLGTTVNSDMTLIPVFETIRFCLGGSEQHNWGGWTQISEASCTTAAQYLRQCSLCLWEQQETRGEAPGHDWGNQSLKVVDQKLVRARTCQACSRVENSAITPNTTKYFETPVISGDAYGAANASGLVDNIWGSNVIDPKQGASISIILDAKNGPAYVGSIVIYGIGGAVAYELNVTYADGTTEMIGIGTNNVPCQFEVKAEIIQIEIYTAASIGGTYFSEIGTFED